MSKFRVLGVAAVGLLTTLTFGGFAGVGNLAVAHAASGGTVIVADNEEPPTMNPMEDSTAVGADISSVLLDAPVNYLPTNWPKGNNQKYHWTLDMASSMPTVKVVGAPGPNANVTITLHIKPNIKWSDGAPVTTKDLWFTWKAIMDPNTGAYNAGWNQVTSIDTPNKTTAIIHMKGTYAPWMLMMYQTWMPYHLLKNDLSKIANVYNGNILSTGPYVMKQWVKGQYMEMVPNKYYAGQDGPRPAVHTLIVKFVQDQNTMVDQMITHEIQLADELQLTNALAAQFKAIPNTKMYNIIGAEEQQYTWNLKDPIAGDLAVRRAFYYGLNRQQIVNVLTQGRYKVNNDTDLVPYSWAYDPHLPFITTNDALARRILQQDGWNLQNGYFFKNGQELTLDITTTAGNELRAQIMQLVQAQEKKVGIKVVPTYVSANSLFASYQDGGLLSTGQFQVAQFAWVFNSPDPDDSYFWNAKLGNPSTGGGDFGYYNNALVNKLTLEELYSMNQAQRTKIMWAIEGQLAKDLPMIPLFVASENAAWNSGLSPIIPNQLGYSMWNANYWHYTGN